MPEPLPLEVADEALLAAPLLLAAPDEPPEDGAVQPVPNTAHNTHTAGGCTRHTHFIFPSQRTMAKAYPARGHGAPQGKVSGCSEALRMSCA